eukprot:gene21471-25119_t
MLPPVFCVVAMATTPTSLSVELAPSLSLLPQPTLSPTGPQPQLPSLQYRIKVDWASNPIQNTTATPSVHNPNSYAFSRTVQNGSANPYHDLLYDRIKSLGTS